MTADACVAFCPKASYRCYGLGPKAGNRYCSTTLVTNDAQVNNCELLTDNSILDTDFSVDTFPSG